MPVARSPVIAAPFRVIPGRVVRGLGRETSDTIGHDDLAGHRARAHQAAARPRGDDPGTLAGSRDPVPDRRLLRLLRAVHGAGAAGDRGFAGVAATHRRRLLTGVGVSGPAAGPLLEQAVRALPIVLRPYVVRSLPCGTPKVRCGSSRLAHEAVTVAGRERRPIVRPDPSTLGMENEAPTTRAARGPSQA
jgi:hypothetical protein